MSKQSKQTKKIINPNNPTMQTEAELNVSMLKHITKREVLIK